MTTISKNQNIIKLKPIIIDDYLIPENINLFVGIDLYPGNKLSPEQQKEFDCQIAKRKIKSSYSKLTGEKNENYFDNFIIYSNEEEKKI